MVGRAKNIASYELSELKKKAVQRYLDKLGKPGGEKKLGLREVCRAISDDHFERTGHRIALSSTTLARHVKGGQTIMEFNATKHHLTPEEQQKIVNFAVECGDRGFPLSPRRIKQHAEHILKCRLGSLALEKGLGKDWATRFINKHHGELGRYWSRPLDDKRGRAVNPVTKEEYFNLLKGCREKYNIPDELVYGADESGLQTGIGSKEYVIGRKGASIVHQQRSGDRENITVLPTICADGTCLAPAIIFKGQGYQTKWLQNNPIDARLSYSKKGYIEGEIGVAWLEDFDKQTKGKAAGRACLLLVDGHASHYTHGFLKYA
ncbi:hypothetical protein D9758_015170 [Tetrapyrgos nigripes]|uniref:HTH CENPB-type domain-containing protein n=1 Tax=Tetrapyrgos nigripes TaxID=182062 RepID=A0A8H5CS22_9AGAR|nr:hypothetical protein D9758_015170 [Tetrapyrgos nigripes]